MAQIVPRPEMPQTWLIHLKRGAKGVALAGCQRHLTVTEVPVSLLWSRQPTRIPYGLNTIWQDVVLRSVKHTVRVSPTLTVCGPSTENWLSSTPS